MSPEGIERILTAYDLAHTSVAAPQKGYRNASYAIDGTHNLILYKSEPGILKRIKNANRVGEWAAQAQLPARKQSDPRILKLSSDGREKYVALYNYLPGSTIPWEAYTMERMKALGQMLATLHKALATFPAHELPDVIDENAALHSRMHRYFADSQVATALQQKLALRIALPDFTRVFAATKKLPQQALHMDFVRGNILFDGDAITGILDFEKTAKGPVVYDIARTLAFLLVDCKHKPEDKVRKYFLQSGYIKRGSGTIDHTNTNKSVLEPLIIFYLLHDFYKFLRHNPYESLPHNEHFMRTKAMLLKRGLIAQV